MTRALNITRMICGILVFTAGLKAVGTFGWEASVAGPKARSLQLAMHEASFLPELHHEMGGRIDEANTRASSR